MSVSREKADLRDIVLARRKQVPIDVRRRFSETLPSVALRLVSGLPLVRAPTVSVFRAIRGEAETETLVAILDEAGVTTALPVTAGHRQPLRFLAWRPGEPLSPGRYGIPEPASCAPSVTPDVVFVPLAAFDRRGFRLGYGAGYYDSSLAALRQVGTIVAVGIAFSVQEVERVPTEPHDERLDAVITERGLLTFGPV